MNSTDTQLQWSVILVNGPDSESFLQGQITQDLSSLSESGSWTLLLQPDSSVIAALFVRKLEDGFSLVVERQLAEISVARLRRFHLRVKCTIELSEIDSGPFSSLSEQINAGWIGTNECELSLTPQCYGSRIVSESISFTKGCFTGQELVGRLDARGSSVPWRLVRVTGPSLDRIVEAVLSKGPEGPKGITSSVVGEGVTQALAIVHRSLLDSEVLSQFPDVHFEADF
jgi:folate-binding Fe-S cluster repair protein YgfZ